MIKKSLFEDEIIAGMEKELVSQARSSNLDDLTKAADYLNSAAEIFDDIGMVSKSDQVLNILAKLAHSDPRKINDPHTKGLTPEKEVKNILHHGTPFNMANDGKASGDCSDSDDDMLDLDLGDDLEVSDQDMEMGFEDEK
jgi:hypothetical protein